MILDLRTSVVCSTVVSTGTLLLLIVILPCFFLKVQKVNTIMMAELQSCHQDTQEIWRRVRVSQDFERSKRSYGRSADAPRIALGKCCSCQQGKPGAAGPKGPDGESGQPGVIGLNGRNGRDGKYVPSIHHNEPACQKCPQAPPGPPGHPGAKGLRGLRGRNGIHGPGGTPGRDGPPGTVGTSGPPGEIGMQGPVGDPGRVLNGGPQGKPGRSGSVGARGKAGYSGRDGLPGVQGIKGERGAQGDRGTDGVRGPPGSRGPTGLSGTKGSCAHCPTGDRPTSRTSDSQETESTAYDTEVEAEVTPATTTRSPPSAEPVYTPSHIAPVHTPSHPAHIEQTPQTINYPDTVAQPSHKHYGDVNNSDDINIVAPAGRYSARQYASKTVGGPKSFGYSKEQLSAFAPTTFIGTTENSGSPRTFQTNKGYNVAIMGSGPTYGAAPVGASWSNAPPRRSNGPAKFLSPPPTGPNTYA